MAAVYNRAQIVAALTPIDVIAAVEAALAAYSRGEAVVPPPGELLFDEPPGDCHIKFAYLKSNDTFTVKIATGFWENPARGLPSSNGVVLVFSRNTGKLRSILQDEGWLTISNPDSISDLFYSRRSKNHRGPFFRSIHYSMLVFQ